MNDYEQDAEDPKDFGSSPTNLRKRWHTEIAQYNKEFEYWQKQSDVIYEVYSAKKKNKYAYLNENSHKINLLWSNVQTLKPLLYARTPEPVVERRHKDKDRLARLAGECLERAERYNIKCHDFDAVMVESVLDRLLPGRAVAKVCYEHQIEQVPQLDPMTGQPIIDPATGQPMMTEQIGEQKFFTKYVNYKDFAHSPARNWTEVYWVAFKSYLTRAELIARFGAEIGKKVKLNFSTNAGLEDDKDIPEDVYKKAIVWEIWNKPDKKVYWYCEGCDEILDVVEDPYNLKGFFPCPKPMYGTLDKKNLIPTPDYYLTIDLAKEIDLINEKIFEVEQAIQIKMAYNSALEGLEGILNGSRNLDVIPVDNWATVAEAGGFEKAIWVWPVQDLIGVLQSLYASRDQNIQKWYEVTGLSDIIRGASNPNETATAQQIKGQFANLRISDSQKEVQRYARDIIQLETELIAEQSTDANFRTMSGYDFMLDANLQDPNEFTQILEILRSDHSRDYRIDIETDSTIAINESLEKEKRTEFLNTVGQFMGQMLPLVGQSPMLAPVVTSFISFAAKGFTKGRQLEDVLDGSLKALEQSLMQPPQQQDPTQAPEFLLKKQEIDLKKEELDMKCKEGAERYEIEWAKIDIENEKVRQENNAKDQQMQNPDAATIKQVSQPQESKSKLDINVNIGKPKPKRKKKLAVMKRMSDGTLIAQVDEEDQPDEAIEVTPPTDLNIESTTNEPDPTIP